MASSTVLYYYHNARGESPSEPNAFLCAGRTLGDFKRQFPAGEGQLHFRFQADDPHFGYVWVDVGADEEVLPTHRGQVFAQVLRLGTLSNAPERTRLRRKVIDAAAMDAYRATAASAAQAFAGRFPSTPVPAAAAPKAGEHAADLMAFSDGETQPPATPAPPSGPRQPGIVATDIDDDDDIDPPGGVGGAAAAPAPAMNLWDEMSRPAGAAAGAAGGGAVEDGEDEFQARHGARIRSWATQNGKPRSLIALISKLDAVLYPGARWSGYSVGDLLNPKKVRIAYFKAQKLMHPQNHAALGLDDESRFIATHVSSALNAAYEVFKAENNL